jgi:hypothetical protein
VLAGPAAHPRRREHHRPDLAHRLHHELDRLHLVTLATGSGTVAQRSMLTPGQKAILTALDLPEPPRFFDFTPTGS